VLSCQPRHPGERVVEHGASDAAVESGRAGLRLSEHEEATPVREGSNRAVQRFESRAAMAALLFVSAPVTAQDGNIVLPTDIAIHASAAPVSTIGVDQPVDVAVEVVNLGPQAISILSVQTGDILDRLSYVAGSADCPLHVVTYVNGSDVPVRRVLRWDAVMMPPMLGVGDTVACHFQLTLAPHAPQTVALTLAMPSFSDIDIENDTAHIVLSRAVAALPSGSALSSLTLIALLIGGVVFGRNRGALASGVAARRGFRTLVSPRIPTL
jgi:hypothetical protein